MMYTMIPGLYYSILELRVKNPYFLLKCRLDDPSGHMRRVLRILRGKVYQEAMKQRQRAVGVLFPYPS